MANYDLAPNEVVMLKTDEATCDGEGGELLLTNLHLLFIKSKGVFKKTYITQRYPINQIRTFNGKSSIVLGEDGVMDIFFLNGQAAFQFFNDDRFGSKKKAEDEAKRWENAISQLVNRQAPEIGDLPDSSSIEETAEAYGKVAGAIGSAVSDIPGAGLLTGLAGGAAGAIVGRISDSKKAKKKQQQKVVGTPEKVARNCTSCNAPIAGMKGQIVRCQYCGSDQQL